MRYYAAMRSIVPTFTKMRMYRRGFTLIELLVAISVLAIVAVLGWRALDSIVRARSSITVSMEKSRGMLLTFAQMQNDCAMLTVAANVPGRTTLAADTTRLILVRNVFADNQPTRVEVVTYRLRDGVLTRKESAATRDLKELDIYWKAAIEDLDNNQSVVLQTGVEAMTVQSWFSDSPGWRVSSVDLSAATKGTVGPSPTGIEVSLKISGLPDAVTKVFLVGSA